MPITKMRIAALLAGALTKVDRVAMVMRNCLEPIVACRAAAKTGLMSHEKITMIPASSTLAA
jgi:hypothetical protein